MPRAGSCRPQRPHEQVVTSAITVFGNTTFSTHTPATPVAGACTSNLGDARVYNVGYRDAAPRADQRPFRAASPEADCRLRRSRAR